MTRSLPGRPRFWDSGTIPGRGKKFPSLPVFLDGLSDPWVLWMEGQYGRDVKPKIQRPESIRRQITKFSHLGDLAPRFVKEWF
jgi:hypothetical protein